MVGALPRACPDVRMLATSREALGITGEIAWRVPSLPVPDPQNLLPLAELRRNVAVQLFIDREALHNQTRADGAQCARGGAGIRQAWTVSPWRWSWLRPGWRR